jgi:hypothetical protein
MMPFNKIKKVVVGERQMFRRVREEKHKILLEIHQTAAFTNIPSSNLALVPQSASTATATCCSSIPERRANCESSIVENVSTVLENNSVDYVSKSDSAKDLPSQLRHWATVEHSIPHNALNSLLKILNPICPELPRDSRTFLNTPMNISTVALQSGELVHIGLIHQIQAQLQLHSVAKFKNKEILLSFNVDGLPLFKSSNTQLWPILGLIKNFHSAHPFVISLFCGNSKPAPLTLFLGPFVGELSKLLNDGIDFEGIRYTFKVHSFVCDAPARAFIKCTKTHGGYSSCDKCVDPGEYIQGRVIYNSVSANKRTDLQFRLQSDEDHHLGESPLVTLPIDLIASFPIDYMHAVCLGVMRKLLNVWIGGDLKVRLSSRLVKAISEKLLNCASCIPVEFNRRPRSMSELARWKATEFRMFLLYTGPVALKNILPVSLYENFLLFHCAITVLISPKHINQMGTNLAHQLLLMFIRHSLTVYGPTFIVYNVHMLSHLCDDVNIFGALDNYSAFPFENYLGMLKHLVRSPNKPLLQIVKRLKEIEPSLPLKYEEELPAVFYCNNLGPTPIDNNVYACFKKLVYNSFAMYVKSVRAADCYCYAKGKVVEIHNILRCEINGKKCIFIYGKEFVQYDSYYTYPFDSALIDIFRVSQLGSDYKMLSLCDIITKCVVIPQEANSNHFICFPMLHAYCN